MKTKLLLSTLLSFSFYLLSSQIPQGFNYQAIARNGNDPITTTLKVKIGIQSDTLSTTYVWEEIHSNIKPNASGLFSLVVGAGSKESGTAATFGEIDWAKTPLFMRTSIYYEGSWKYMGSAQLWTVPYAMVAGALSGPVNKLDVLGKTHLMEESLFEVKNKDGQTIFAVYNEGVRIWVSDGAKGTKGGFVIGGFSKAKGDVNEYLTINSDSTTISTSNQSKKVVIKNPNDSVPLLNVAGSIKMGYDSIASNGIMGYNGSKFLTYEKSDTAWKQFVVTGIPEVITDSVYRISRNGVSVAGDVIKDGGSEIVARGVCWSTTPNPTLMDNSLKSGNGKGRFLIDISGLKGSYTYYLRTFATNSKFTNYGEEKSVNTLQPVLPSVKTTSVTSITGTSAVSGGNITDDGSSYITSRGVCWNTTGNPGIADFRTTDGGGAGIFTSNLTALQVNKTYFIRAYATNSVGTVYGEEFSFATTDLPVLSTNPITAVSGNSATTGGNIFAGGELSITQRGVCWNKTGNPTLEDTHTLNGTGTGSFVTSMNGLTPGTTYFVRAYATNTSGSTYGNEYFFTTMNVPTITTDAVSLVTGISATCGGNISFNGGAVVTERGICWNITGDPVVSDTKITVGDGTGVFSAQIAGLTIGTKYYVRAYATNGIGTAYGNLQSFTTQNYASVTTGAVTNITYTTATGGGEITSDGGAVITQRGICWNTTGNPVVTGNHTNDGSGAGLYTSIITGLAANNTYYVRAYAINSIGTTYGQQISFSTPIIVQPEPGLPLIATVNVTTSSDGYHTGGYISSDGGSAVTQRGICWSSNQNPTLTDNHFSYGPGTGLFNILIPSLEGCGINYYIRAYATNNLGTGYGNQVMTNSGQLIKIETTITPSNITKTSAISGGIITNDGGCEVTERGICWSRKPDPTVTNYKTVSGSGIGSYSSTLTGLYPNDTYYVRAYATNSQGTKYGPEISFRTQAGSSGAAIGQFYAGGYVFYLDETGDHGLVSAPSVVSGAAWGCFGSNVTGTQDGIGTGALNTALIIANCTEIGIAARLCDELELNGYSDWYLPSLSELGLIYNYLFLVGIGSYNNAYYWSSYSDGSGPWMFCLPNGTKGPWNPFNGIGVQPVRTF